MTLRDAHVVKLGGSLLDLPDLLQRFEAYRADECGSRTLLVVGGGAAADVVRRFDEAHHLGEPASHWLAVRAMQLGAHLLAAALPAARLVSDTPQCTAAWEAERLAIMDPLPWLEREARAGVTVPHHWQFTSDSIAAHVAHRIGAARLTLLKSRLPTGEASTVLEAARLGVVDQELPRVARGLRCIELVNLRTPARGRCMLQVSA